VDYAGRGVVGQGVEQMQGWDKGGELVIAAGCGRGGSAVFFLVHPIRKNNNRKEDRKDPKLRPTTKRRQIPGNKKAEERTRKEQDQHKWNLQIVRRARRPNVWAGEPTKISRAKHQREEKKCREP